MIHITFIKVTVIINSVFFICSTVTSFFSCGYKGEGSLLLTLPKPVTRIQADDQGRSTEYVGSDARTSGCDTGHDPTCSTLLVLRLGVGDGSSECVSTPPLCVFFGTGSFSFKSGTVGGGCWTELSGTQGVDEPLYRPFYGSNPLHPVPCRTQTSSLLRKVRSGP